MQEKNEQRERGTNYCNVIEPNVFDANKHIID